MVGWHRGGMRRRKAMSLWRGGGGAHSGLLEVGAERGAEPLRVVEP